RYGLATSSLYTNKSKASPDEQSCHLCKKETETTFLFFYFYPKFLPLVRVEEEDIQNKHTFKTEYILLTVHGILYATRVNEVPLPPGIDCVARRSLEILDDDPILH
ncbi:Hypothetical protein FKW44_015530, partial [Caligus rogercresseyi]